MMRAHTLSGYRLLEDAQHPGVVGIAFKTDDGLSIFAATKDMLEQLAEAFRDHAAKMPAYVEPSPPNG